ncbi:MAG: sulfite exporter TauE/SafE family protein [Pararhodobacter sp.]
MTPALGSFGPGTLAFLAVVVFVSALIRGFSGFGYPVLVVAAGALVVNPLVLVPVAIIGDLVLGAQHWRAGKAHVQWGTVIRLVIGAGLGLLPGVWILAIIDETSARIVIGVLVLLACVVMLGGWTLPGQAGPAATLGMGVVSGLAAPAGVAGPPAVTLVAALGLSPLAFRATLLGYFIALDALTIGQFALAGRIDTAALWAAGLSLPLVITGSALGARLVIGVDPQRFRRVVIGVLALMAMIGLAKVWL